MCCRQYSLVYRDAPDMRRCQRDYFLLISGASRVQSCNLSSKPDIACYFCPHIPHISTPKPWANIKRKWQNKSLSDIAYIIMESF